MMKFSDVEAVARHADEGDQVQVLIVAEGATSLKHRDRLQAGYELSVLAQAAQAAGSILGAAGVELLDLPDNRLDSLDRLDLIKQIENRIDHYRPEVVYVHHSGDVNVDHRRLHEAVITLQAHARPSRTKTAQLRSGQQHRMATNRFRSCFSTKLVCKHLQTVETQTPSIGGLFK